MNCALKMSEAAAIALHAVGYLAASPGKARSTRDIAGAFNVSEAHLSKVLQRLAKVGLVISARGPGGGFSLSRDPSQTRLLEVFEAIEGPVQPVGCLFAVSQCDGTSCILGTFMLEANQALLDRLTRTSVAEISRILESRGIVEPLPAGGGGGTRGREGAASRGTGPERAPPGRRRSRGRPRRTRRR